jgi:4-amino-4-deoxy-L-arabinose transferase-like glycosyltransferase
LPNREVRTVGKKITAPGPIDLTLFDDEDAYISIAHNLTKQGLFTLDGQKPTATRVPLYPLLLSAIFLLTPDITYALWLNAFLAALVALGCYKLAQLYWSERAGHLAMLIVGLSPHTFNWFLWLQAEALLSLLVVAFLIALTFFVRQPRLPLLALSGLLAGLAALTRPEAILLIPLYAAYLGWHFRPHKPQMAAFAVIFAASAAVVVVPWTARNYLVIGYPGLSTIGGFTFAGGHNEITLSRHLGSWYALAGYASEMEKTQCAGLDEAALDKYLWQRGLREVKNASLGTLIKLELAKLHRGFKPSFRLWGKEYNQEVLNAVYVLPFTALYLFFFVLCCYQLLFARQAENLALLWLVFLLPLAVTLIFWGNIRFRAPYEPLAFTICSGYLAKIL